MAFNLGPGGGVDDPQILILIAELTSLVKKYGPSSYKVSLFIENNKNLTFVNKHTDHMHTFKELAEPLVILIGGIEDKTPEQLPGDNWQSGKTEDIFGSFDPDDPADYWKAN